MFKKIATAALIAVAAFSASAFELKGFTLGAEMKACPAGFVAEKDGAVTRCSGWNQTLAGKPVEGLSVAIANGKIMTVTVIGMESPDDVAQALVLKYGKPTSTNQFADTYYWRKGDNSVHVDASRFRSSVVLMDLAATDAIDAAKAKAAQSDL